MRDREGMGGRKRGRRRERETGRGWKGRGGQGGRLFGRRGGVTVEVKGGDGREWMRRCGGERGWDLVNSVTGNVELARRFMAFACWAGRPLRTKV